MDRVGVSGSGSLLENEAWMRGRVGVGALGDATLDSMSSTSCASMLSRLLDSVSRPEGGLVRRIGHRSLDTPSSGGFVRFAKRKDDNTLSTFLPCSRFAFTVLLE